jgi:hypothetical protein
MDPFLAALLASYATAGAGSMLAVMAACLKSPPDTPKAPEPKPDPLYVGKPKALKPANRAYGARRSLIQGQRAWLADEARAQLTAQLDGDTMKATGNAFADWFETRIIIPANATAADVISFNDWVTDYNAYCDSRSISRLQDGDLHAHMDAYAKGYHCTLDSQGNYHGGHLKP